MVAVQELEERAATELCWPPTRSPSMHQTRLREGATLPSPVTMAICALVCAYPMKRQQFGWRSRAMISTSCSNTDRPRRMRSS